MADKKIDPKCVEPCPCGATWYDAEENPKGKVTIIKRKRIRGCGSSAPAVVCTACGRSAWPAGKQLDAVNRWNAQDFQYGPLKEDD